MRVPMRVFVRFFVLVLLVFFSIPCFAQSYKIPVQFEHPSSDVVGQRLAFHVKELIRKSEAMRLHNSQDQRRVWAMLLTLSDDPEHPDRGSIYSITIGVFIPRTGILYETGTVGYTGKKHVQETAESLVALIDAGGSATLRQLAHAFLSQDESQLIYYEDRIKQMPLKILGKHGIVTKDGDLVVLNAGKLTLEQKAKIKMLCEQKLQENVAKRGLSIWDYRLLDKDPIPDRDYYRVLKESGGRCSLCGATKNERPLHVDHIKPRSKGGKTEYPNLQVLCSKCNLTKGNKDETDFRQLVMPDNDSECRFCHDKVKSRVAEECGTVWAIRDGYPVSDGHQLILPKRHTLDWFSMTETERRDADALIRIIKNRLAESDQTITGFNIGINSGESAGQTIFHAHIHLIPRRDGDTPNPRGGVRGVIPGKMGY